MKSESVYLTTTLPYVNADPHIGYALEAIHADAVARHYRLTGKEVFFNIGTDEHGQKIYQKAHETGQTPQAYTDHYAASFRAFADQFAISYDRFIRTTESAHKAAAEEMWRRCEASGDIYKKEYEGYYCVGCELFYKEKDLVEGKCALHPNQDIQILKEENYFFRFSKYGEKLLELYQNNPRFVVPSQRLNEIKKLVEEGLEDFSISRLAERMPWGVSVPGDESQVMYVWFDALTNYVSTIGWPENTEQFERFWPVIQFAGKDQVRQQAAMWQAMLMSAGLTPSEQIVIHGFITSGGQKMSKSLGNVIDPIDLAESFNVDSVRYYLLRHISPTEDSDFTIEKFGEAYEGNLVNGLGNLVSRVLKMRVSYEVNVQVNDLNTIYNDDEFGEFREKIERYDLNGAVDYIFAELGALDQYIAETEPFKLIKTDREQALEIVAYLTIRLNDLAALLLPFMPSTAEAIHKLIVENTTPEAPLFPRK